MNYFLKITVFLVFFLFAGISVSYGQDTGLQLTADSVSGLPGAEVIVPVRVKGFSNMITSQGTISFDPQVVKLLGVEQYGLPNFGPANFNLSNSADGKVLFSWDDATLSGQSLPDDATLFTVRFKVVGTYGMSSNISFISSPTKLEFANKEFQAKNLGIVAGKVQVPIYTVNTSSLDASAFCSGSSLSVVFTTQGNFPTDNSFVVELSNSKGSFNSPIIIGIGSISPIQVALPADIEEGAGYRIRVIATVPQVVGSDNGGDLAISYVPAAPSASGSSSCGPGVLTLSASGAPAGGSYRWYTDTISNVPVSDQKGESFTTRVIHTTSTYYVTAVNNLGCESERVPVKAQIYDLNSITAGPDEEACIDAVPFIPLGASPEGGVWSGAGITDAGMFDPSSVGAGTYTIKYTFTCANGSIGEAYKSIRVIDLLEQPKIKQIGVDVLEVDLLGASYEWEGNGQAFTSTTNRIKITEPGFYKVRVLDGECISEESEIYAASFYSNFVVYPNPSFGTATLSGPTLNEVLEVEVFNIVGKKVFSKSLRTFTGKELLELYHLSPDMYFLTIRTSNTKQVIRFAVAI